MVECKVWSNFATFNDDDSKSVRDVVRHKYVAVVESTNLIVTFSTEKVSVEFNFADDYWRSLHERILFDLIAFKAVPHPNPSWYFIGINDKVKKQAPPVKVDYPANVNLGTIFFFVNCNILQHQGKVGVKAPVLLVKDTEKRLTNGNPQITWAVNYRFLLELQFKNLLLDTVQEKIIEAVAVSVQNFPFVRTGLFAIIYKVCKFWKINLVIPRKLLCLIFWATQEREESFRDP